MEMNKPLPSEEKLSQLSETTSQEHFPTVPVVVVWWSAEVTEKREA